MNKGDALLWNRGLDHKYFIRINFFQYYLLIFGLHWLLTYINRIYDFLKRHWSVQYTCKFNKLFFKKLYHLLVNVHFLKYLLTEQTKEMWISNVTLQFFKLRIPLVFGFFFDYNSNMHFIKKKSRALPEEKARTNFAYGPLMLTGCV